MAKYISVEIAKKALADSNLIPRYAENCKPITDRIIDSLTAADVEPVRHGLWLPDGEILICLNCEAEIEVKNTFGEYNHRNYCPNCGAKMDGGV